MPGIFYTSPLTKSASSGASWAKVEAVFPELQVFANVLLSRYGTQSPERFTPFQITRAEAYIVTPQTPTTTVGGIAVPSRLDNTVYLKTNRLTFWLAVNNGSSAMPAAYASAVGIIYDTSPTADFAMAPIVDRLDLAVYAEDGSVVSTNHAVRLEGGAELDEDQVRETALAEGHARAQRAQGSLKVAAFEYGDLPSDTDFRVDPATGRVEPLPVPQSLG